MYASVNIKAIDIFRAFQTLDLDQSLKFLIKAIGNGQEKHLEIACLPIKFRCKADN